ncbi:hypothetical protein [Parvibaculum sp.]|uniref:hypothetical protein n=1 Tax=Parvibaculum sp. TaxID=2024848 RepID=UPI002CC78A22|nr:hypothetical protein [Parvibaculum sp.]HUD49929.1 hypothetical protein [Parvibaculum sp.]
MSMKSKADDNRTRAPHGQGPARGQQAKEARLAEALRANLRKRKAQAKGRDADADGKGKDGK